MASCFESAKDQGQWRRLTVQWYVAWQNGLRAEALEQENKMGRQGHRPRRSSVDENESLGQPRKYRKKMLLDGIQEH